MTDRAKAFIVHLDDDYRLGDEIDGLPVGADAIIHAIRMIKGVVKVESLVAGFEDDLARQRALTELRTKMWDVLR